MVRRREELSVAGRWGLLNAGEADQRWHYAVLMVVPGIAGDLYLFLALDAVDYF